MNKTNFRVIFYGFLAFIILEGFMCLYDVQEIPFTTDISNFILAAVNLFSHFSLALVVGMMIIPWLRTFTFKRPFTYSLIAGLIGCFICFYNIIIPLNNHYHLKKMESILIEIAQPKKSQRLKEIMNDKKVQLDIKSSLSYSLARDEYRQFGTLAEYINKQGENKIYIPTNAEVKERNEMVNDNFEAFYSLQMAKNDLYYQVIFWISVILFNIGFSMINRNRI